MTKIERSNWYLPLMVLLCISCGESTIPRDSLTDGDAEDDENDQDGDSDTDADNDDTDNDDADNDDADDNDDSSASDEDDDTVCDSESFEVLEGGYVCAGDANGYAWTNSEEMEGGNIEPSGFSTIQAGGELCVTGTTDTDYNSIGILGVSASQEMHTDTTGEWTPTGSGIDVTIQKNGSFPVRFQINTSSGEYCVEIDNGANSIEWSDLRTECWSSDGDVYNGSDPIELIMLMVPGAEDETIDFDLCLEELVAGGGSQESSSDSSGSDDTDDSNTDVDIEEDCSEADRNNVCDNEIARHCGYTYEFWREARGGCMDITSGGGFSVEWNESNRNVLARKGVRPGSDNIVVNYEADYSANGVSYLGIYGWTQNPLVEYYIVDSWGEWRPPDADPITSIETDGGRYEIYRTQRIDKPSIEGDSSTFDQYWSVRTQKRTSGTITVGNHFDAWRNNNMNMGNFYEVSMVVEGYQSAGSANVKMSMSPR